MVVLVGHGHDAAVREIAVSAFKLKGCVMDVMACCQHLAHFAENRVAFRGRNVLDGDV